MNRKELIDVELFESQGFGDRQTTLAYCEEGNLDLNVSPYGLARRGKVIYDPVHNVEVRLRDDMEFGVKEREGMMNMFNLVGKGVDTIFWISPSGGSYVDARLVVARVVKTGEETELECRGIVCKYNPDTLFQIATRMVGIEDGMIMNWVSDAEGLRSQPIGFVLSEKGWIDFGIKMFGMKEVWEAIRRGEDVKQMREIESVVGQVKRRVQVQGYTGRLLTIQFELEMAREGYRLNLVGNHGGSSLKSVSKLSPFENVFGSDAIKIDINGEVKHKCHICGYWYTGDKCPLCDK